ncbi:MAG: restriction endonuclease [Alphaproteobacteria bacterium]|nr:restriction endonuclease [Alphaproteobacteria bacterium]
MTDKDKSKTELFLELAKPNKEGFSRAVNVNEFKGKYATLILGNGGSWCRSSGSLGRKYNVRRNKKGNKIESIELHGLNKNPIGKNIPKEIHKTITARRCVVLNTSNVECDHKDGRLDDPRLNDPDRVTLDDFQPLSEPANKAKRQQCKTCRNTGKRFDARVLGYNKGQVRGNGIYTGTCVGCYWYDPLFFNQEISK